MGDYLKLPKGPRCIQYDVETGRYYLECSCKEKIFSKSTQEFQGDDSVELGAVSSEVVRMIEDYNDHQIGCRVARKGLKLIGRKKGY